VVKTNRLIHEAANAITILEVGDLAFIVSDQLANAAVGPLSLSVRGDGRPQALGAWQPTCRDTSTDANALYRNLVLQDRYRYSEDLAHASGFADAAKQAVAPLATCPGTYRSTLARILPSTWADVGGATVVSQAISDLAPGSPGNDVATAEGFGPVRLGMTIEQVLSAVGPGSSARQELAHCTTVGYATSGGEAVAYVHDEEAAVIAIETPDGTLTDRGVGDGSSLGDLETAYGQDHAVETTDTQAGRAAYVTTGDPDDVGFGNPGGLIGFELDGDVLGPPMVGGIPGFEYCSG